MFLDMSRTAGPPPAGGQYSIIPAAGVSAPCQLNQTQQSKLSNQQSKTSLIHCVTLLQATLKSFPVPYPLFDVGMRISRLRFFLSQWFVLFSRTLPPFSRIGLSVHPPPHSLLAVAIDFSYCHSPMYHMFRTVCLTSVCVLLACVSFLSQ